MSLSVIVAASWCRLSRPGDQTRFWPSSTTAGKAPSFTLDGCMGMQRPAAVIAELRGLFSSLPKPGNGFVWAALVSAVETFNALELLPEVRQAFAEGLVDETMIGLHDIDPSEPREPRSYPHPSAEERLHWFRERNAPIDAINECSAWICFQDESEDSELPDEEEQIDWEAPSDETSAPIYTRTPYTPPQSYIAPPRTGRNEPCPCGSGKKYKKCCGQ